jgi:small subunit ribosomal protein S4
MKSVKCKICRRLGRKMFIKGARCFSPKCAMVKRPYAPGQIKKNKSTLSEYGREFSETQKIKRWYGLRETQFKNYVVSILDKMASSKERSDEKLIRILELRLDNTVLRLGLADSHAQARKIVSHGHISVNGKKVNIPSFQTKKGDIISVMPLSKEKAYFKTVAEKIKKYQAPSWIKLDTKNLSGEIIALPSCQEVALPIKLSSIFEHYSK